MASFDEITAEVERTKSVTQSAIALLNGIAARIDAAIAANDAGDNTALGSLSADIRANADSLAAAVQANT